MRKALICALVLAALSAAVLAVPNAIAGTPDGRGAQKRQLVQRSPGVPMMCPQGGATTSNSARPHGFVSFNTNGRPGGQTDLTGRISLKNGAPGVTYTAYLQMGAMQSCQTSVGTLTTNGQGNGNLRFQTPETTPSSSYWIVLKQTMPPGATEYATASALVD